MNYTTVTKVREHSGFVGNSNISDTRISQYIARATQMVNSKVGKVYQIPLPTFWQNTIVFSGTGSGSGTLSLVFDGVTISISITAGLTASQAADLFRRAVLDSDDITFSADNIGSGSTVTITAKSQTNTVEEVTPDATVIQSGITATGGTTLPTQHPFIEYLATEGATCLLLISEYGPESQDSDKDGFKRLALLKEDFKELQNKTELLMDEEGTMFPQATKSRIRFSPRDGSVDEDGNEFARRAKWNEKY